MSAKQASWVLLVIRVLAVAATLSTAAPTAEPSAVSGRCGNTTIVVVAR